MKTLLVWLSILILASCGSEDKKATNDPCKNNTDCADNICHQGICAASARQALGQPCSGNGESELDIA